MITAIITEESRKTRQTLKSIDSVTSIVLSDIPSLQDAISEVETPLVLITDGRNRFREGISEVAITEALNGKSIVCPSYRWGSRVYQPSSVTIVPSFPSDRFLSSRWKKRSKHIDEPHSIPSAMGCMLVASDWIKGMQGTWKTSTETNTELILSIMSWMRGGDCRLIPSWEVVKKLDKRGKYPQDLNERALIAHTLFTPKMLKETFIRDRSFPIIPPVDPVDFINIKINIEKVSIKSLMQVITQTGMEVPSGMDSS